MEINTYITVHMHCEIIEDGNIVFAFGKDFNKDEWAAMTDDDLLTIQTAEYDAWKLQNSQG